MEFELLLATRKALQRKIIEKTKIQNYELRHEIDELELNNKKSQDEIEKLSKEVFEKRTILDNLRNSNMKLEEKIINDLKKRNDSLDIQIAIIETEISNEKLMEEKEALITECNEMKKQNSSNLTIHQLENKIENLKNNIENIREDNEEAESNLNDILFNKITLTGKITEISPDILKKVEDEVRKKLKEASDHLAVEHDRIVAKLKNDIYKVRLKTLKIESNDRKQG